MMKKLLTSPQFKIITISLAMTIVISAAITGTIAFFTDSKESTSVYTAGNVYIELSSAEIL